MAKSYKLTDLQDALERLKTEYGDNPDLRVDSDILDRELEKLPEQLPATMPFKYYLHDHYEGDERAEVIAGQLGISPNHPVFEKMSRPFYEVTLDCELNTVTGEVKILGAKL